MRIAIITIVDGANYGNRLQNYALQEILKNMGNEVETIQRKTYRDKAGIPYIEEKLKILVKRCLGLKSGEDYRRRKKVFSDFNRKYLKFSSVILKNNCAPKQLNEKYDYFVCGSDQIWNPRIRIVEEDLNNYLASFASSEKKIAYAASFGTDNIPEKYKTVFEKELKTFKTIGLRENSGIKIVHSLCPDAKAKTVLDPTMLLTSSQWERISKRPNFCNQNEKYIVTYFLGGRNEAVSNYINNLASTYGCKVINLENEFILESNISDSDVYCTGPDEFIWLIKNAQCVLTDSFHATVFSLIFHKKFCVFERTVHEEGNDMSSRITTLLSYFGLEECRDNIVAPTYVPREYSGDKVDTVIKDKQKESIQFLKEALT